MLRCAIVDRGYASGAAALWAKDGVDFVQLRDKTLASGELSLLARSILDDLARVPGSKTQLLVNSNTDVAIETGAAGVHLTSSAGENAAARVRQAFRLAERPDPVIGISCHTLVEVDHARDAGVSFILFGPVFEKRVQGELVSPGTGLERLREACLAAGTTPVLALGGVTCENSDDCVRAGAAGVAGIRLFA